MTVWQCNVRNQTKPSQTTEYDLGPKQSWWQLQRAWQDKWQYLFAWGLFLLATSFLIYVEMAGLIASWWRWGAIMLLSWWLPGLLLVWRWSPPHLNGPMVMLFALGLGWCWQIALLMVLHWLPGPLFYSLFLGGYAGGALLLLLLCRQRRLRPIVGARYVVPLRWSGLLLLLLFAVTLRLPGLGYHEFHQDETHLLRRAKAAIEGEDEALARHTKGIGEIAAVMVVYRALHMANEPTARLPFGVASVGSILALALLGSRLFHSEWIGLAAGLLLTVNGFALGLSRIAQYQPVVLLLSILALLAMWEFYQTRSRIWLTWAILLSAFGLVMHYEFLLTGLPLLWLLIAGWRRTAIEAPNPQWAIVRTLFWGGLAAVGIVAATYLPLLLNPYFATTTGYLNSRLADGRASNFAFFAEIGTLYNSIYFGVGLLLLVAVGIGVGWRRQRMVIMLLTAWSLPALILYLLIVEYPGTHFYLFMPAWSLLAAPALVALNGTFMPINMPHRAVLQWALRGGTLLWFAISITYLAILFFRQSPAYLVNYPETRLAFYWAPYGEQIPQQPRFGFPIHQGWKTLGVLADWGYMTESYASNERSNSLRWYLRGYDRVALHENPDYIFIARHLQERDSAFREDYLQAANYQHIGEVQIRGEPHITIWAQQAPTAGYLIYDAARYGEAFDHAVPALRSWLDSPTIALDATLDDTVTLYGATQNRAHLAAGDLYHLVLWWEVEQPIDRNYKVFVHVANAQGQPLAQWDGFPGQNTQETAAWQIGMQFQDHVLIPLPNDLPAGDYRILVGLYDPNTGDRLDDQVIEITTLKVS